MVDLKLKDIIPLLRSDDINDVRMGVEIANKNLPYSEILRLRERLINDQIGTGISRIWFKPSTSNGKIFRAIPEFRGRVIYL